MKKGILTLLMALLAYLLISQAIDHQTMPPTDYADSMRQFVIDIKTQGTAIMDEQNKPFFVVPQNGLELTGGDPTTLAKAYLEAIDGQGQESMFVGYGGYDVVTDKDELGYIKGFTQGLIDQNIPLFLINYAKSPDTATYAHEAAQRLGAINLNASPLLNALQTPEQIHKVVFTDLPVESLQDVQNFMYLINPEKFTSDEDFIGALAKTQYDLLVIDAFGPSGRLLTADHLDRLKRKPKGAKRLVLAYMSIGEAESYRWYFKGEWLKPPSRPGWLEKENPLWEGNFHVDYWHPEWQNIIIYNKDSYLHQICTSGFDGVYLDVVDAFLTAPLQQR